MVKRVKIYLQQMIIIKIPEYWNFQQNPIDESTSSSILIGFQYTRNN